MIYLTNDHKPPPLFVTVEGMNHPIDPLISRQDNIRLAQYSIFPHHPSADPTPLGSEWVFQAGEYYEQPIGTPEEISAAIEAQDAANYEAYLDSLECTRLQGKLALIEIGLWDQYVELVNLMLPTMTPQQRVFFEDAQTWKFRDPVLQAFVSAFNNMDQSQVIALFELAKTK